MNTRLFLCTTALVAVCALSCNGKKDAKRETAETTTAGKEEVTDTTKTEKPEENPKQKTWVEEQGLTGDVFCVNDSIWHKANYDEYWECYADDDIPHLEHYGLHFDFYEICKTTLNEYGQPKATTSGNEGEWLWEEELEWKDKYTTLNNIRSYNGGNWDTLSYFYDNGRLSTTLQRLNPSCGYTDTISYKYDSNGRIAEIRFTEGRVESKIKRYTYIDENDSYKEITTNADGETTETTIYLDSNGRTTKELSEDEERNYQYDNKGLLTKETCTYRITCEKDTLSENPVEDALASIGVTTFTDGLPIREATTQDEKNVYVLCKKETTYKYKYDKRGNWIEKEAWVKRGDNKTEIEVLTTRTIRYKED